MTDDLETTTLPGGPSGKHRSTRARRRRQSVGGGKAATGPRGDDDARDTRDSSSKKGAFFRELVILVLLVLGLTALLRGLVFEAYVIPSGSMENTLRVGDKILVNKLEYRFGDIDRGDVVVFDGAGSFTPEVRSQQGDADPISLAAQWVWQLFGGTPANEEDFVKRVVGVGGDRVECRRTDSGFAVFVNGARLREGSYLFPDDQPCRKEFTGRRAVVVPEGRLWVMGDHRSLSADSREHMGNGHRGTVPEAAVIGRAFVVVWPTSHWGSLPQPDTYGQRKLHGAASPELHRGSPEVASVGAATVGVALLRGRRRQRL